MADTTLHVIDGTATLFRAYFGAGRSQAPDGREVGAVAGFCRILNSFVRSIRPTHVALVFDSPGETFRHRLAPSYKANRRDRPDDLESQLELAREAAAALGFRRFSVAGFEADDLMATLARRGRRAGLRTVLVSPDKDVLQLVDDRVVVLDPRVRQVIDAAAVVERFGVAPPRLVDALALAGDATDNVPGVKGVGLKSATAVVAALGTLEDIYADLDAVAALPIRGARALAARLAAGRDDAWLGRELVRLRDDVPLSSSAMSVGMLRYRGPVSDPASTWLRAHPVS